MPPPPFDPTRIDRRLVLGGLLAGIGGIAEAGAPASSLIPRPRPGRIRLAGAPAVESLIAASKLSGTVGFTLADAITGEILESRSPLLALPPASVTKAVTALFALDRLGGAHRFATRAIATAPLAGGRIDGDLILMGGGDPTLDTDALADLARALRDLGLREVTGRFLVHSSALPYAPWIDGDQPDHLGYNPAVSGLNLNFNRVFFEWKRNGAGYAISMDARTTKYRPEVRSARMRLVDRKSPVYTYEATRDVETWTVAAGALGANGGRWLPVRQPDLYAADVFQTLCRSFGIVLKDARTTNAIPAGSLAIAQVQSADLGNILRLMLKFSNNMTAESVGMSASQEGGNINSLRASGRAMSDWVRTRMGVANAKFVDHSGLGEESRISTGAMVRILGRAGWDSPLRGLMKDVDFRDDNGRKQKTAPFLVEAKTGTLNFTSNLAGYATLPNKRRVSFAIFTFDQAARRAISRAERENSRGNSAWIRRSRGLQQDLLERWAQIFG